MKRENVIACIRIAGYHADYKAYMRLYAENRISKQIADEAFKSGIKAKENKMQCGCFICKKSNV